MNPMIKHNGNAKYWAKDLKGEYTGSNFSILDIYLNIFSDQHIIAKSGPTAVGYGKLLLSNALWRKFAIAMVKANLNQLKVFKCIAVGYFSQIFVLWVQWVFLGKTLTPQICLYVVFIRFMWIFMEK